MRKKTPVPSSSFEAALFKNPELCERILWGATKVAHGPMTHAEAIALLRKWTLEADGPKPTPEEISAQAKRS